MRHRSSFSRPLAVALALVALPVFARADEGADPAKDPQVARLLEAKKTLNWNHTLGASKDRYGHAEALVDAPADKVAKTASEFGQYRHLHRKFATARVIAKEGDQTDVYMRYPVQIGPVTIELYEVMRFNPTRTNGNLRVIEARGIKGDMKRGHTVITVKPVDAKHSLLSVDILLVPTLPAPQSYVDEELRDGAQDFVNGLRDKAQGAAGPVVSL
jgi:carbon monoxide dehydrogenase subunit G